VKPSEARRKRRLLQEAAEVRGEKLEAFLAGDGPQDKPSPHLVPTAADKTGALREYRRLARLAAGEVGVKREHLLDRAIVQLVRVIYVERVLMLAEDDPLAHAALTPAKLVELSFVDRAELRRRFDALQGDAAEAVEGVEG